MATLGKALTRTSAHGKVSAEPADLGPVTRLLRPGTQETVVEVDSLGGVQHLLLRPLSVAQESDALKQANCALLFRSTGNHFRSSPPMPHGS